MKKKLVAVKFNFIEPRIQYALSDGKTVIYLREGSDCIQELEAAKIAIEEISTLSQLTSLLLRGLIDSSDFKQAIKHVDT